MLKEACLLRQVYRGQSRSSSPVGKQVTGLELVAGDRVGRGDVIHPAQEKISRAARMMRWCCVVNFTG